MRLLKADTQVGERDGFKLWGETWVNPAAVTRVFRDTTADSRDSLDVCWIELATGERVRVLERADRLAARIEAALGGMPHGDPQSEYVRDVSPVPGTDPGGDCRGDVATTTDGRGPRGGCEQAHATDGPRREWLRDRKFADIAMDDIKRFGRAAGTLAEAPPERRAVILTQPAAGFLREPGGELFPFRRGSVIEVNAAGELQVTCAPE